MKHINRKRDYLERIDFPTIMIWSPDVCFSTMRAIWEHLPYVKAGGDDVGTITGISLEDCKLLCCQRHCDAVNYQADTGVCEMKTFSDGLVVSDVPGVMYNVSITQDFQGRLKYTQLTSGIT